MFKDRQDAGRRLAAQVKDLPLRDPVVLAIPRGGVEVGAVLARELHAELDVVLSRKLHAPAQPELALGAVSETGEVYLDPRVIAETGAAGVYVEEERRRQLAEIERRRAVFRAVRPKAPLAGRSVIVTDDGIATGSTMIAALRTARAERPHGLIVAVPVAPPERIGPIRDECDRVVCLSTPEMFWAIGQFYEDFGEVTDERAVALLREFAPAAPGHARKPATGAARVLTAAGGTAPG
jgi:putative phosphoribosyl transferase